MSEYFKKEDVMQAVQDHFNQGGFDGYQDGQDMMQRITALHGIEIVPCEECVYSQSAGIYLNGCEIEAMWCDFNECYMHKTDFCSMGEKQCKNKRILKKSDRAIQYVRVKTEEMVHIICPKWKRKDTPSEK